MSVDLMPLDPSWASWAERLRWHLREIPELVVVVMRSRVPVQAVRYDRDVVTGSRGDGPPAPVNVDALDDADELWRTLAGFAYTASGWLETPGRWAEDRGEMVYDDLPEMTATIRGGVVIGMAVELAWSDLEVEASAIVRWLGKRAEQISARDELRDAGERLCDVVRRLRSRYLVDRASRARPLRRPCRTCGEVAVVVEWAELVSRTKAVGVGRCERCGQTYVEKP